MKMSLCLGWCSQSTSNFLQQLHGRFTGFGSRKVASDLDDGQSRAGVAETFFRNRGSRNSRANYRQIEPVYAHQEQCIPQVVAGMNVVSGAVQEFADEGNHVDVGVDAQYGFACRHWLFHVSGQFVESGDSGIFAIMSFKQLGQMRKLQDFQNMLGDGTQLEIAANLAGAGQRPHHRA